MLNADGKYTKLSLDDARTIVLQEAANAGVEVLAGSVEDQIKEWLAQFYVSVDSAMYAVTVKEFNPTGSDIDIQNPGFPRLQPAVSKGFLKIDNTGGGSPVPVPLNTILTAPNGNTYTNPTAAISVAAGQTGFLAIQSVDTGKAQNLPPDQVFSGPGGGVITNPQPITGGRDLESDSDYLNRLTYYKSNNTSQQATVAARKELLEFYQDAKLYVNSSNNGTAVPVPIPPQGLNPVVILASGIHAGLEEIQAAINILTNRFEFGNLNSENSTLHPILQGSSYAGVFPQSYSLTVAQAVTSTVDAQVQVSFPPETLPEEKLIISQVFATQFVQRLVNLLTGSDGSFNFSFTPSGGSPLASTVTVAASPTGPQIGPFVSIEAIRSLVSGADSTGSQGGINLLALDNLSIEFDTGEYEQNPVLLSIFAPYEGTLATVNFILDALFTDGTSWYDRYIFLDPSRVTVAIVEA